MIVGLLECDHVDERFRDATDGDYLELFGRLFGAHVPDLELRPFDVVGGELPDGPEVCDGWVCTGSRHSAYDDLPWIADLQAFIREVAAAGRPFVGICFGHQVLAQALGGRVERASGWGAGVARGRGLGTAWARCASTSCTRTRWSSSRPAARCSAAPSTARWRCWRWGSGCSASRPTRSSPTPTRPPCWPTASCGSAPRRRPTRPRRSAAPPTTAPPPAGSAGSWPRDQPGGS